MTTKSSGVEQSFERQCPVFVRNNRPALKVVDESERSLVLGGVIEETGRIILAVSTYPAQIPEGPCGLAIENNGSPAHFPICGNTSCPFTLGSDFRVETLPKKPVISEL